MHKGLFELAGSMSPEALHLVTAVFGAGKAIKNRSRKATVPEGLGFRSIVTEGDELSCKLMVEYLVAKIPGIKILSEEKGNHPALLSKKYPEGILGKGIFAVIDPIDSTVRYAHDMSGWCVGAGLIRDGVFEASAIYAPANNGGVFILAVRDCGVWCTEWNQAPRLTAIDHNILSSNSVALVGVDVLLYQTLVSILPDIGKTVRAVYTSGSGILGLAMVASGKASVIVQTPQKAWDWAPGYRAVVESGNVFQFFRIKADGIVVPVEAYDFKAFCYEPQNRLGFIAGMPFLVEKIWRIFPKLNAERIDPEYIKVKS